MAPKLLGNTHIFHLDATTCEFTACRGGALLELEQKAWSKEESYSEVTSAQTTLPLGYSYLKVALWEAYISLEENT